MQSIRQYRRIKRSVEASPRKTEEAGSSTSSLEGENHQAVLAYGAQDKDIDLSEVQLVFWDGPDDPLDPRNWSLPRKIWIFTILWINVFAVDWASSADSQAGSTIAEVFGVSEEAEALSPSLYTFGIAFGALFAGPIAETVGRNPIYVLSRCLHVAWLLGAALAPNFAAQCVFRLFAGLSASILLAIHAASIADIFGPLERTIAWPIIALASFLGKSLKHHSEARLTFKEPHSHLLLEHG